MDNCAVKKFEINSQWRNELFFIVMLHFSLRKSAMNAPRIGKLRKELTLNWPRRNGAMHGAIKTVGLIEKSVF
jgi:hypothetical protein